jgi:hypothetical protein
MEGLPEINRGPRRARRREMMQRTAHPHEDDESSISDMRSNLDAARHAALTSFSAEATGSLRQIGTLFTTKLRLLYTKSLLVEIVGFKGEAMAQVDCFPTARLHLNHQTATRLPTYLPSPVLLFDPTGTCNNTQSLI